MKEFTSKNESGIKCTTECPFIYKPICGGFEIHNGRKNYTRPIYSPHMNDDLLGIKGKRSTRFIYYLGDHPKLALQSVVTNVYKRHAHMFRNTPYTVIFIVACFPISRQKSSPSRFMLQSVVSN